ncbi:MAG: GntR family transcriptional regulator [Rhodospirillales bacterium]|nr:GntR family transcriptional regulator [Rhodospirillales bacterium]
MRERTRSRVAAEAASLAGSLAAAPADAFDLPKLQRNTLNEAVYQQLKQALMSGRIAPGSTMTIRSLASSFGVSLMPVREALRRLVAEHVLVLQPNRSVALPVITRERFREITRIRTSLEGLAAEEAAAHLTRADIDRLDALNQAIERPGASRTPDYLINNREFHFAIYRNSGMPTLLSIIESLWVQIGPLLTIQQRIYSKAPDQAQLHHRRALRAFRRRDGAQARAAIVADIQDAAEIIAEHL